MEVCSLIFRRPVIINISIRIRKKATPRRDVSDKGQPVGKGKKAFDSIITNNCMGVVRERYQLPSSASYPGEMARFLAPK